MSLEDHEAAQESGTFPGTGGPPDTSHTLPEVGKPAEEPDADETPAEGEGGEEV